MGSLRTRLTGLIVMQPEIQIIIIALVRFALPLASVCNRAHSSSCYTRVESFKLKHSIWIKRSRPLKTLAKRSFRRAP